MTGMDHTIERAAEIIGEHVDHYIGIEPDQPLNAARALAEAGFLAPAVQEHEEERVVMHIDPPPPVTRYVPVPCPRCGWSR